MTVEEMLEKRHTLKLLWMEPWQACGPNGVELTAHIELRATVNDCINMSRVVSKASGFPTDGDDANHLLYFIAVHWATPDVPAEVVVVKHDNEARPIQDRSKAPVEQAQKL